MKTTARTAHGALRRAGAHARVVVWLLLCLCCRTAQADAWTDENCRIVITAYRLSAAQAAALPGLSRKAAFPQAASGKKSPIAPADSSDDRLLLALTLTPPPSAYLYGPRSTEGLPTRMEAVFAPLPVHAATVPSGDEAAALLSEKGRDLPLRIPRAPLKNTTGFASSRLPGSGDANPPIYPGPVTFWAEMPASGGAIVRARMSGLLCTALSCTPASGKTERAFTAADVAALPAAERQGWWPLWVKGEDVVIDPPPAVGEIGVPVARDARATGGGEPSGAGDAPDSSGHGAIFSSFEPRPFDPDREVRYLGEALLLGLAAGLLLNLMPCVLPVVSLKFSALMAVSAMTDRRRQAQAFKRHCLVFALGIIACFLLLAFLLGVAGWAWGELFQEPVVVLALGMLLFVLGLSLFGVFSLPIFDLKVTTARHPHWQAFASGFVATLLATPCSGPLLGGVLAWAIRQPLPALVLTVVSVGMGMAAPYGILACNPRLVHLLPRPGAWTIRLEQLLGFFLMGSVVYLATLLPGEWLPAFLFNLLAVALAAWLWGQIGHLRAGRLRRGVARAVAGLVVMAAAWWGSQSVRQDFAWEAFDPERFIASLGQEALLLEFTADWCPSCKAMEYATLTKKRMADLRKEYKVRTIRVDLTRDAGAGKDLLKALNSTSIPVLALFPKGDGARQPVVLRDLVTPGQLKEAALRTFADH
jgi:thiol:disulfide interchange protein DsbD